MLDTNSHNVRDNGKSIISALTKCRFKLTTKSKASCITTK